MALFGLLGGKKTSVGLDIGSGILKVAVVDHSGSEPELQILDPSAEGLQTSGRLVAAKRERVGSRTSLLGEAGLQAAIIDVDAFAIHNAFELNHPDAMQGVVAIANIGHEITNVNILEDGVPVLTRDLSLGTRRFREDLQREKGLSAEDSEKVIQGQAQHPDLASYVDARGEEIAVGVERAAAVLATASRSAGGLSRVYTAGGGSRVPGLNDALSSRLKVPVEQADPGQRLQGGDGGFDAVAGGEGAPPPLLSLGAAPRRAA